MHIPVPAVPQSDNSISRRTLLGSLLLAGIAPRAVPAQDLYGVSALTEGAGMVRIAPGEFLMGAGGSHPDELPIHRVRISRPFEIGKFEVTQAQWAGVLADAHPRPGVALQNAQGQEVSLEPSHFKGPALPVESVSWYDVQLFLARLNARDPGHQYRLPTEAEWEYCCGASSQPGWIEATSDGRTHAVGQLAPNSRGLFDMQGNVAEWVHDWYGRGYYAVSPPQDPAGPDSGSYRVFRGGSWLDAEKRCHPAFRGFDFPVNRVYNVGFRVVRTVTTIQN